MIRIIVIKQSNKIVFKKMYSVVFQPSLLWEKLKVTIIIIS